MIFEVNPHIDMKTLYFAVISGHGDIYYEFLSQDPKLAQEKAEEVRKRVSVVRIVEFNQVREWKL